MAQHRGFFNKLFDFSFSEFVAIQIVGILFGIGVVFAGIAALAILVGGFTRGFIPGVIGLILSPLIFLLYVIFVRIGLEAFIASIRTAENTKRIAEYLRDSNRSM